MPTPPYPDIFDELKAEVRAAGLLKRMPLRGSVEMAAVILSLLAVFATITLWNPFLLGLFMALVFTRAVFVSHDILHRQYFKDRTLSMRLSYPFAALILSNSSSWWDLKHNVNHHTWCNVVEKDEDIRALNGAFTPQNRGDKPFIKRFKYIIFWGAMFFMYPAFIAKSYSFVIRRRLYGEPFSTCCLSAMRPFSF
jgi:fatty acid desaturase